MATNHARRYGQATTRNSRLTRPSEATVLFDPDLREVLAVLERARSRPEPPVT
jgi:hypothetical protein